MLRNRIQNRTHELLQLASGEELLLLAARSNAPMRRQIEMELDRRSMTAMPLRMALRGVQRIGRAA